MDSIYSAGFNTSISQWLNVTVKYSVAFKVKTIMAFFPYIYIYIYRGQTKRINYTLDLFLWALSCFMLQHRFARDSLVLETKCSSVDVHKSVTSQTELQCGLMGISAQSCQHKFMALCYNVQRNGGTSLLSVELKNTLNRKKDVLRKDLLTPWHKFVFFFPSCSKSTYKKSTT